MLLVYCTAIGSFAQSAFSGKLIDESNQPLPYANVVLLSLPDSVFVTGTISDTNETFALKTEKSDLLLRISSIGYTTLYKRISSPNLGTLQLTPDTQMLGEVVVKADMPKVWLKGDAQVTTVQGSILEKAGTGNDLLNKLPGVSADDGTVNVFGAGAAEIYINGRKMRDASELDQLNFNYRKGGFDLGGMLYGSNLRGEDNKTLTTETFLDKTWRQVSDIHTESHNKNLSAMLSMNYQFNDHHFIGARYDFDRSPEDNFDIDSMSSMVYQNQVLYEENTSRGTQNNPATSHSLNVYYNGQAGDWNIDFNADGMWSYSKIIQDMLEQYTPASGTLQEQRVTTYNKDENTLYAAKLIISRPL